MITGLTQSYPPDAVEHRVPDVATARAEAGCGRLVVRPHRPTGTCLHLELPL